VVQRKLWFAGDEGPTKPKYVQSRDDVYEEIVQYVKGLMEEAGFITEETAKALVNDQDILSKLTVVDNQAITLCIGAIHGRLIKWADDDEVRPQMSVEVAVKQAAASLGNEPLLKGMRQKIFARAQEAEEQRLQLLPTLETDPAWLKEVITRFVGRVEGVDRFASAVRGTNNYAYLTGYEFQAGIALQLGENLGGMEVEYQGALTQRRYVDLQTKGGEMIECKVLDKDAKPSNQQHAAIMKDFFYQALDYAMNRTKVNYYFKNGAPAWALQLLYCASAWGNGPISVKGAPVQFPPVIGSKDSVPIVEEARGWFTAARSFPPPPLQ
jgi:hypothetical protein